jgi:hypothetical protein
MPQNGTHRLATACRTPPASLSMDWSPAEDSHLTSPAYKAGAPLPVRDGQNWWAAQESHLDHAA